MNNAIKHAQADQILIQLAQEQHTLTLTVEDNGRGFDKKQAQSKKSAGLLNIQSRVDFLKGRMDLQSSLGLGTTVEIELPIV
ncbi:histidine kinase/DNA gyrase B/HSP90-like ATPase [Sphingobacterium paludis]|uniref:Histidine kinase/DNA gyrase B/HSP90-like ATPase n=1 Tax=Sphingobacterium paludis TaxID=1476465 RepID=A0A4R7D925_9SPHI|nr:histidine kinase/DNA gyrase B/HSP90-like ATPase [Sphingobacterium paludis]